MIGKLLIVVLALAAFVVGAVWAATWFAPVHVGRVSPKLIHVWNVRDGFLWLYAERNRAAWDSWNGPVTEKNFSWWRCISAQTYTTGNGYASLHLDLNLLAPCALLAVYPVFAFIRGPVRRNRRRKRGLCVQCGYNLTGNVSGRCPECGMQIDAPEDRRVQR